MTVREIYDVIDQIAPFSTSMDFDNTGILKQSHDSICSDKEVHPHGKHKQNDQKLLRFGLTGGYEVCYRITKQ